MSGNKAWIYCCLGSIFISAGLILWAGTPSSVKAQCGDIPPNSSCFTCHEKELSRL